MKSTAMDRRKFLQLSASAAFAALPFTRALADASITDVHLTLRPDRLGNKIAVDFAGLSYESAQLGNPQFFSGDNTALIGFVRRLGNSGVLRIGGNTSAYCYWTPDPSQKPAAPASVVGPDKGLKAPPPAYIGPQAIRNLKDFLDATSWNLIYGLNMGTGTPEDAAAEAAYVMDAAGSQLLAFQLCNEPDLFFKNGVRMSDYGFAQFAQ